MTEPSGTRSLRAIMVTDVVGYSAQMREDETRALAVLARQRVLLPPLIASHGGALHKEIGDGLLASFSSAVDALQCARTIQRVLTGEHFRVRIGLHLGDVVLEGGDVFGDGVNVAARIEPLAEAAGITVSADFLNAVRSQPGFLAESLGPQALKNLGAPMEVFAVREAPAPEATRPAGAGRRAIHWPMVALVLGLTTALGVAWLWQLRAAPDGGGASAVEAAVQSPRSATAPALQEATPAGAQAPEKSVAVLPFVNMSADPEQEYFSDGITEELLNHLAQVSELRVTARTSSFAFKGRQIPIPEIAAALGVAHVLEGSVRRAGKTLRITAQLIRASDGIHLWSQTYDRPLDDIFRVQDEISAAVTQELKARLLHPAQKTGGVDPVALEYYLRAKHEWEAPSVESLQRAVEYLEAAVRADPGFVDGWSLLAISRFTLAGRVGSGSEGFSGPDAQRSLVAAAREDANRALAIDPGHAPTHARLAAIDRVELGLEIAAAHMRRALQLNASDPVVQERAAELLAYLGRLDQAIAIEQRIVERDPLNEFVWIGLGGDYESAGRLAEAEAAVRRALALNPRASARHAFLGLILLRAGRPDEAEREIAQESNEPFRLWAMTFLEHVRQANAAADTLLGRLEKEYGSSMAFQIAEVHACRGNVDGAFRWLDEAERQKDLGLDVAHLSHCLAQLDTDPRWLPFLRRIDRDPERLARIRLDVHLPESS